MRKNACRLLPLRTAQPASSVLPALRDLPVLQVLLMLLFLLILQYLSVLPVLPALPGLPVTLSGPGTAEAVDISIRDDIHVQPVAEFTGSGGYPEIITLENRYLKVTSIPRRGRVIHGLEYKPTGRGIIYSTYKTLPMDDSGVFIYEIGGVYFSNPWNPRDVQPYDMEYEIIDGSGIRLRGTDFDTKLYTEIELTLKDDSSSVRLFINHLNNTGEPITLPFWDRFIFNPGEGPEGICLNLPVDEVRVVESAGSWLGEAGEVIDWPAPAAQWQNIKSAARFRAAPGHGQEESQPIEVYNAESGERVRLECDRRGFSSLEVLAYGPDYRGVMGAFPGYRLTRFTPEFTLKPGEAYSYNLTLTVNR